jgi:hypothetical protein
MQTRYIAAVAVATLCASAFPAAHTAAQSQTKPAPSSPSTARPAGAPAATPGARPDGQSLTGTWRSDPYTRELSSDFEKSVWGPNAQWIRTVELAIRAGGESTLTVTTRVLDARRRTVPGSTSIEVAQLAIGAAQPAVGVRTDRAVTVTSAERRYPDDPKSTWPIEGLRVQVTTLQDTPGTIDLRFDTPEGRGSFWETLKRAPARGRSN